MTLAAVLFALAFGPMLLEARLSSHNERALRARGAVEPATDVFRWMQVVYPAAFAAMIAESSFRPHGRDGVLAAGIATFTAAKAIKYWAIGTLGPRWTFRVLVPPKSVLVTDGPYRFVRHPNYIGVMGELAGFALMAHAVYAGVASVLMFAWLIARRIRVEERALRIHPGGTHRDHAART
jgi:methyltransferase